MTLRMALDPRPSWANLSTGGDRRRGAARRTGPQRRYDPPCSGHDPSPRSGPNSALRPRKLSVADDQAAAAAASHRARVPRSVGRIRPAADMVLRLQDGRRLGVAEFGARTPLPVIYLARLHRQPARAGGRRDRRHQHHLVRPAGLWPKRSAAVAVAARLGCRRRRGPGAARRAACIVVGVSTGAPYALAVAAALGPRAREVILAGGIAGPGGAGDRGRNRAGAVAARAARQPDRSMLHRLLRTSPWRPDWTAG